MLENIKKRIIHFYTHGNIIEDFVEARRKKALGLRRVIRACFYIQCALAVCCIAAALLMRAGGSLAIAAGSAAVCIVAFISLGGGTAEKTILYILDLVYAVICFIVGGLGGSPAFTLCGGLMLLSAAVALCGFFAAWCRQYLLDFSPAKITSGDYTLLSHAISAEAPQQSSAPVSSAPAPPPPPPKTEMEMLAEKLSEILRSIPDVKTVSNANVPKEVKSNSYPAAPAAQSNGDKPAPGNPAETNNSSVSGLSSPSPAAAAGGDAEAVPPVKSGDNLTASDIKKESAAALPQKDDTQTKFHIPPAAAGASEASSADTPTDG